MTSPLARGPFAKAVVMSGGNGDAMGSDTLRSAEKIGSEFAQSKGIALDDPQAARTLREGCYRRAQPDGTFRAEWTTHLRPPVCRWQARVCPVHIEPDRLYIPLVYRDFQAGR